MKRLLLPALASGLVWAPTLRAEALWEQSKRWQQSYNVVQREHEYAQRVIDTSNRNAQIDRTFTSRWNQSGSYFNAAREQSQKNWDNDYESKPLTREQTERLEREEKARMAIQARIDAETAKRERERQEMLQIVAQIKERAATEEARRAGLDEQAKAGNREAAIEAANLHVEHRVFTPLELDRIRRAAEFGYLKAIAKLLTLKREIPAEEFFKWETAALVWGEPNYTTQKAKEMAARGDRDAAAEVLERGFARNPDVRTLSTLAAVRREQGRVEEAISVLRSAMKICEETDATEKEQSSEPVLREIAELPVTSQTAPYVLHLFIRVSRLRDSSVANVLVYVGDIFSGQEEKWRGLTMVRSDFRDYYERAAKLRDDYNGIVGDRFAALGDFATAEKFFAAGIEKKDARTVLAAGRFWARRTDGKADGRKAVALLGRVAPGGDLQTYSGIAAECGDILRTGQGVSPDIDGAVQWYHRGHSHQEIESTRRLAALIYSGEGMPKDEAKALQMLDEVRRNRTTDFLGKNQADFDAAVLRFTKAMQATGGKPAEVEKVFEANRMTFYLLTEAREPDPRALEFYGRALLDGDINRGRVGVVSDGWKLLERAANLGNRPAQAAVEFRKLNRHAQLSSEERAVVFKNLLKLAEQGEARGAMGLGVCYRVGIGTSVDADKAQYWLQWASAHGLSEARALLIVHLKEGSPAQRTEADRLVREDAESGSVVAQTEVAMGHLARSEAAQALEWLEKAGAQRYWPANYQALKIRYEGAPGVEPKGAEAFVLAQDEAEKANDAETIFLLAQVYAKDTEVESFLPKPDYKQAVALMSRAYDLKLEKADDKRKEYEEKI